MSIFFGKDEPPIWLSLVGLIIIISVSFDKTFLEFLIIGIFAILCARQCYKWSIKINSNIYAAYFIGLLFSLFGLLLYYIYYKNKIKRLGFSKLSKSKQQKIKETPKEIGKKN